MRQSFYLSPKEIAGGIFVALLFLTTSYASEQIAAILERHIGDGGVLAMGLYTLTVSSIVMIPLATTLPLVPVAVALWGNVTAAILTVSGWIISAALAFTIARRFGAKLLHKFRYLETIRHFGDMIPRHNLWWGTLLLGMIGVPADIFSYALGLFTPVHLRTFLVPYVLGTIPFAFFISYTTTLPIVYQTYIVSFMLVTWFFVYAMLRNRKDSRSITDPETYPPLAKGHSQDIRGPSHDKSNSRSKII
jgi:uncharacterized membrane protein YdjX (TVP38/TMEM64 family)